MQKILFVQEVGNDQFEIESLWCEEKGEHYVVDNIPFIAKNIALGDIIIAEYDQDEKAFYFEDFIEFSGNSTIRLRFPDSEEIEEVRRELESHGCSTEAFLERLIVSVNVPKSIQYAPIREFLMDGEQNNRWEFEEACLAHDY
ncbi:DUF4265 domain-containing protein [Polluticoccus soli]|uniref:DUF4265 domain-containing protein n=1 Tax=Polluticoccus soli TaxID=3034150 RepID=UPI0023E1D87D|nr:DUF4265 domain-containing protein [Flavipsychrobacter sp. JY13-12]